MKIEYSFNLPVYLTLFRLAIIPFIIPFLIMHFHASHSILLAFFYFFVSLSDFFDGYLARKFGVVTKLGALLDPLADKLVLLSTLISLSAIHRLHFFWAIVLISREFIVTGLRLIAAEHALTVPVFWSGKIKTVMQDLFIMFLLITPKQLQWINYCEYSMLSIVLLCSIGSALHYYVSFIKIARQ